jgi:hypothetical protein
VADDFNPIAFQKSPNAFSGFTTFGGTSPASARIPFKSSQVLTAGGDGTNDHVAHLFQTILAGDWTTDTTGIDPGFGWGTNFYTTTGTTPGSAHGMNVAYGGLLEFAMSSPDGHIATVVGFQAEASFAGPTSGGTVDTLTSMYVKNPRRKDGATAGTATTVYGLRVAQVTAADTGATTAYTAFVEGGRSQLQGNVVIQANLTTETPLIVRNAPSSTGRVMSWQSFNGGSDLGGVTSIGGLNMPNAVTGYNGGGGLTSSLTAYNDGGTNKGSLTLGTDTVLYRVSAAVFGLPDGHAIQAGSTNGLKIATGPGQKLGFFGATPVARQSAGTAATDSASAITLVNTLRTSLMNLGLAS